MLKPKERICNVLDPQYPQYPQFESACPTSQAEPVPALMVLAETVEASATDASTFRRWEKIGEINSSFDHKLWGYHGDWYFMGTLW